MTVQTLTPREPSRAARPARPPGHKDPPGLVFDVDTFAVHDGPGIRMAVYLKGCPLACAWCHSPESQRAQPELIFLRDRCELCGECAAACAHGVHAVNGEHRLERAQCAACGHCVESCPAGALSIKGAWVPASAIVARAARMQPFFTHSSGGVTLSGGEVSLYPEFAEAVLAGCRAQGIHTAIETCGAAPWSRLERLVRAADLVLYDLKLYDDAAHRRWTGVSNRQILANARRLAPYNVQVRVPLIPGITDTEDNLRGIFSLMRSAGLFHVALLPYNPSAGAKYQWLDRPYGVVGEPQAAAQIAALAQLGASMGLVVEGHAA